MSKIFMVVYLIGQTKDMLCAKTSETINYTTSVSIGTTC